MPKTGINAISYMKSTKPYLEKAGMMSVPLRAEMGMRVMLLEALAFSLPLVSTPLGCEGTVLEDGCLVLIAVNSIEFAHSILQLLDNRPLAEELGRNGRILIENTYDYCVACQTLEQIYQ
jgi:glycosyltransferase involved in cell wall biosynthesis